MNPKIKKIFLVSVNPDQSETHTIWKDHTNLDVANKEFSEMRNLSFNYGHKPLDGYVYEGYEAAYGNKAVELDMVAFTQQHASNLVKMQA